MHRVRSCDGACAIALYKGRSVRIDFVNYRGIGIMSIPGKKYYDFDLLINNLTIYYQE